MPVALASAPASAFPVAPIPAPAVKRAAGEPTRILIPKLRVNALVEKVGLAADGSMGIPSKPKNTAWYSLGPRPGDPGSATISGHVNWLYGATAVFAGLYRLKPGDVIKVRDADGKTISFIVRGSRTYGASDVATDVFFSNDGKAHLNLITCGGVWDRKAKQYTKRLVVFTDMLAP